MKLTWWHDKPWGQHSQSLHCDISSQRNWFDGLKLWRPEGKSPFNHQYHIFFLNEIRWNESPEDNKMHCAKTWKAPSDISLILEEISILNICPPNNFLGAPYSSKPISHSLVILTMNISVLIHNSESALKPRFNLVNQWMALLWPWNSYLKPHVKRQLDRFPWSGLDTTLRAGNTQTRMFQYNCMVPFNIHYPYETLLTKLYLYGLIVTIKKIMTKFPSLAKNSHPWY